MLHDGHSNLEQSCDLVAFTSVPMLRFADYRGLDRTAVEQGIKEDKIRCMDMKRRNDIRQVLL
jgi:hypothetical protein